jgi:hypothetical protein
LCVSIGSLDGVEQESPGGSSTESPPRQPPGASIRTVEGKDSVAGIRRLVVDNSVLTRKVLTKTLRADVEIEVVGSTADSSIALSLSRTAESALRALNQLTSLRHPVLTASVSALILNLSPLPENVRD